MKYVVLLLVFAVFYAYWRSQNRPKTPPPRKHPCAKPLAPPQDMLACDHCGLHLPRSEALTSGAHHYCCAEHQRQHQRRST